MHAGAAVPYDTNTFIGEIEALVPCSGVADLALKGSDAGNVRIVRFGENAERGHQVTGYALYESLSVFELDVPASGVVVPLSRQQLGVELHVLPQVMASNNVLEVCKNFRALHIVTSPRV